MGVGALRVFPDRSSARRYVCLRTEYGALSCAHTSTRGYGDASSLDWEIMCMLRCGDFSTLKNYMLRRWRIAEFVTHVSTTPWRVQRGFVYCATILRVLIHAHCHSSHPTIVPLAA